MKNILILTYVFPPYVAVGGYRILKFCKFLPSFGYNPVILTPSRPNTMAFDEKMLELLDPNLSVYRTPTLEPFRWKPEKPSGAKTTSGKPAPTPKSKSKPDEPTLVQKVKRAIKWQMSVPDSSMFWSYFGIVGGLKAIKQEKIDLILSSAPPQSVHLLGSRLASISKLPHLLDFRDLWTQNTSYAEKNIPENLQKRDRRFELKVLNKASGISVNTATFKQQLLDKNSFLDAETIKTVTNGVDPDDFKPYAKACDKNKKFTMIYTGSLYGQHRNPEFFLEAIKQWVGSRPELLDKIKIIFIGNWSPGNESLISDSRLGNIVEHIAWMPQREVFEKLFTADLLLLFQGFDAVLNAAIPRKLFEYMITNKNVLAFAPDGEIPKLIKQYDCGLALSDRSPEPIVKYLEQEYNKWLAKTEGDSGQLRAMPDLETKAEVGKLAALCDNILKAK